MIRGGTTSVGLAAAAIAKKHGAQVSATTRNADRVSTLQPYGVDKVFVDSGEIASLVRKTYPNGIDKVLELIGTTTIEDSLRCAGEAGIVCMTGIVGNKWALEQFAPMQSIPTSVCLTSYAGEARDFMRTPLAELTEQIAAGTFSVQVGRPFAMEDIVEAHRTMEANTAGGKIAVLVD